LPPTTPVRAFLAPTPPAPTPPRSGPTPAGPRPPRRPLPLLTRTYDRARTPPPRRSRLPHLLRPFPRRLHRGGHRAAGARRHHDHALRRVRRGHLVRLDLSLLGPGLLGVVPDPRPDLHGLRGARLRPVDEDALGPAAHAAADVLRRHPRALLLRRALDPPEGRVGSRAPPHPAGRRARLSPRDRARAPRSVTRIVPAKSRRGCLRAGPPPRLTPVNDTDQRPVLVADVGAPYAQLIARRIRVARRVGGGRGFLGTVPGEMSVGATLDSRPRAPDISGGPTSVNCVGAPRVDPALLEAGGPVLGLWYGFQSMAAARGGTVEPSGL